MIYIAGRFEAAPRLRPYRDRLRKLGVQVSSTWLEERVGADPREMAKKDVREVRACTGLLLDTFDEDDRGGREVEFGLALALDLHVTVIGPGRNIFHNLAHKRYDTWEDFFNAF